MNFTQVSWTLGITAAIAIGSTLLVTESVPFLFGILCLVSILFFIAYLSPSYPELAPLALLWAAFFVDSPWGRAFYNWDPFTKPLGHLLLSAMHKSLGLNGVSISIFEASSMTLALAYWLNGSWRDRPGSQLFWPMIWVALIIPLAALFGIAQGMARGNDLGLALTQTRALASLPIWFFIGWSLGKNTRFGILTLITITADMLFKCAQGLYFYLVVWNNKPENPEYIIEHLSSDYIASAIFFLIFAAIWIHREIYARSIILLTLVLLTSAHILNHRRSSMIGIALTLALSTFVVPTHWVRRNFKYIAISALLTSVLVTATWNMQGPLGFLAHTFKSVLIAKVESSRDYRIAENLNLYAALSSNILLGVGLGTRFPIVYKMANISVFYSDFDLIPHNTLIFLWTFIGPIGITAFAVFVVANMILLIRVIRRCRDTMILIIALVAFTMLVRWCVFVYSDLGLIEVRSLALLGVTLGNVWRLEPQSFR